MGKPGIWILIRELQRFWIIGSWFVPTETKSSHVVRRACRTFGYLNKGFMDYIKYILGGILFFSAFSAEAEEAGEKFNPKHLIFEHLGDEYGWRIGKWELSLPVIVRGEDGVWHLFGSDRLRDGGEYRGFRLATAGKYEGKVVGIDEAGTEYRPWDFSITKNALSVMICALVLCGLIFPLVRWHKKYPYAAPRRWNGIIEVVVEALYRDVIVSVLGGQARRYAPYLLTLFFFILVANLMGLIAVFPGGSNLMGNISITLVLSVCTFVVVNFSGRKSYWKEIFWPEVPLWLKFPVPMMPVIEWFGIFTKPVALMIRLFANIMGGHMIMLVLISLIFIFSALGTAAASGTAVVAVIFAVFMGLIDLLICFIQAYVFFMLSTLFISLALPENEPE